LGNVQGNPYEQNIGEAQGALASLDKAVSAAAAIVRQQPGNAAAAHALAWAEQSQGEVLFGMGRTQEAVAKMRSAAAAFYELGSRPGAGVDALMDAASAYGSLGDELGQSGTASLGDPAGALEAFRKALEIEERTVRLDPHFARGLRGIAVSHVKIANITVETDPAAALPDYRKAIDGMNALPEQVKSTLLNRRTLTYILLKDAMALKEVGRYREALSYMEQVRTVEQALFAVDPNDTRAGNDLLTMLENESECFEEREQGIFAPEPANQAADAASALRNLSEARSLAERLLEPQPDNLYLRSVLGLLLVRISLQQRALHQVEGAMAVAARGVALLKAVGKQPNAQAFDLDAAATGLTIVMPAQLRDPRLAVEYAERLADMSHRRKPGFLLTLAGAYRAAGRREQARAAARQGLALLPAETPATVPCRVRKQLEAELVQ
jgi:tetratricopeptide (TPR) repeat protein